MPIYGRLETISAKKLFGMGISHLNAGSGEEISIKELSSLIQGIVGFDGEITFNQDYPDGMLRKLLDITKITDLGWKAKISLAEGVRSIYDWYLSNLPKS